jgi:hypothetical protein
MWTYHVLFNGYLGSFYFFAIMDGAIMNWTFVYKFLECMCFSSILRNWAGSTNAFSQLRQLKHTRAK